MQAIHYTDMNIKQALDKALSEMKALSPKELRDEINKNKNSTFTTNLKGMTEFCHSTEGQRILNQH